MGRDGDRVAGAVGRALTALTADVGADQIAALVGLAKRRVTAAVGRARSLRAEIAVAVVHARHGGIDRADAAGAVQTTRATRERALGTLGEVARSIAQVEHDRQACARDVGARARRTVVAGVAERRVGSVGRARTGVVVTTAARACITDVGAAAGRAGL